MASIHAMAKITTTPSPTAPTRRNRGEKTIPRKAKRQIARTKPKKMRSTRFMSRRSSWTSIPRA